MLQKLKQPNIIDIKVFLYNLDIEINKPITYTYVTHMVFVEYIEFWIIIYVVSVFMLINKLIKEIW